MYLDKTCRNRITPFHSTLLNCYSKLQSCQVQTRRMSCRWQLCLNIFEDVIISIIRHWRRFLRYHYKVTRFCFQHRLGITIALSEFYVGHTTLLYRRTLTDVCGEQQLMCCNMYLGSLIFYNVLRQLSILFRAPKFPATIKHFVI
jgi:hypothetical protein